MDFVRIRSLLNREPRVYLLLQPLILERWR